MIKKFKKKPRFAIACAVLLTMVLTMGMGMEMAREIVIDYAGISQPDVAHISRISNCGERILWHFAVGGNGEFFNIEIDAVTGDVSGAYSWRILINSQRKYDVRVDAVSGEILSADQIPYAFVSNTSRYKMLIHDFLPLAMPLIKKCE